MHKSRLAGFIIDCSGDDLSAAAEFWGAALGFNIVGQDGPNYVRLDANARDLQVEVQSVSHQSRVHLDIESDDVDAEVARLEKLGARQVERVHTWCVMEAPTGQRFCVIRAKTDLASKAASNSWE